MTARGRICRKHGGALPVVAFAAAALICLNYARLPSAPVVRPDMHGTRSSLESLAALEQRFASLRHLILSSTAGASLGSPASLTAKPPPPPPQSTAPPPTSASAVPQSSLPPPPPPTASPPPRRGSPALGAAAVAAPAACGEDATLSCDGWYAGRFLLAELAPLPTDGDGSVVPAALRLLKSLLGLSRLLGRTLILPAALCRCPPGTRGDGCAGPLGPPTDPFGCELHERLRRTLPLDRWREAALPNGTLAYPTALRPATFLSAPHVPDALRKSHVRVRMPDAMSDSETSYALRGYVDTVVLEVERASDAFCGWDARGDVSKIEAAAAFERDVRTLLALEGSRGPGVQGPGSSAIGDLYQQAALPACQHFHGGAAVHMHMYIRVHHMHVHIHHMHACTPCTCTRAGGAGEVLQFTNLGAAGETHLVEAPFESLPPGTLYPVPCTLYHDAPRRGSV